jgi:phospholipid N-methyltransferase
VDARRYLSTFVKDLKIGALTQSTKYVVRAVTAAVGTAYRYIVEYGAGDGILCRGLLQQLPPEARVTAVERNEDMFQELQAIGDPRLQAIRGDAFAMSREPGSFRLPRVDAVITSIPLSLYAPREREQLIASTYALLAPGGSMVVYQYTPLVLPLLKKYFRAVKMTFEPRNVFPYFIMRAEK